MSGKKGMQHYPAEMKLEAVRQFHEEGRSPAEITRALGIGDPNRVRAWLKQYRREGYEGFSSRLPSHDAELLGQCSYGKLLWPPQRRIFTTVQTNHL